MNDTGQTHPAACPSIRSTEEAERILFEGEKRVAHAAHLESCVACRVQWGVLMRLLHEDPAFRHRLLDSLEGSDAPFPNALVLSLPRAEREALLAATQSRPHPRYSATNTSRWRPGRRALLGTAAGIAITLLVYSAFFEKRGSLALRVEIDVAPTKDELFRGVRSHSEAGEICIGVKSDQEMYLRLVSRDDAGRLRSLGLDPQGSESEKLLVDQVGKFGGWPRRFRDGSATRTLTHVLVIASERAFDLGGLAQQDGSDPQAIARRWEAQYGCTVSIRTLD